MGRPVKNTVDYFPHMVTHKRTMFILEQQYENDGYAFWFKLLEVLGGTENHVFDTRNTDDIMFLAAKTRLEPSKCIEILNLLAKINAIDQDLWSSGLVWCQNFVDGISCVYKKRNRKTPCKPNYLLEEHKLPEQKSIEDDISGTETPAQQDNLIKPDSENTQRREENRIEKKRKEKKFSFLEKVNEGLIRMDQYLLEFPELELRDDAIEVIEFMRKTKNPNSKLPPDRIEIEKLIHNWLMPGGISKEDLLKMIRGAGTSDFERAHLQIKYILNPEHRAKLLSLEENIESSEPNKREQKESEKQIRYPKNHGKIEI